MLRGCSIACTRLTMSLAFFGGDHLLAWASIGVLSSPVVLRDGISVLLIGVEGNRSFGPASTRDRREPDARNWRDLSRGSAAMFALSPAAQKERGSNLRWSPSTVRALPGMCPNRSCGARQRSAVAPPGELTCCKR